MSKATSFSGSVFLKASWQREADDELQVWRPARLTAQRLVGKRVSSSRLESAIRDHTREVCMPGAPSSKPTLRTLSLRNLTRLFDRALPTLRCALLSLLGVMWLFGCSSGDLQDSPQRTAEPRRFTPGDLWRALDSRNDVNPTWVSTLLIAGLDPNITRSQGETPLHVAARWSAFEEVNEIDFEHGNRWYEVAELLLDAGANPSVQNNSGHTPLHDTAIPGDARTAVGVKNLSLLRIIPAEVDDVGDSSSKDFETCR